MGQCHGDALQVVVQHFCPTRNLLTETKRHRVHQMGAANLDHVGVGSGLYFQRLFQFLDRFGHGGQDLHCGDVHRRGKGVVGALRFVDVVVGMDGLFAPHHTAGNLDRPIADDFVDVHVGLRA